MTRDPVLLKIHALAEQLRRRAAEVPTRTWPTPVARVLERMRAARRAPEPPPPHWSERDEP